MKAYLQIFIAGLVVALLSFETASAYEPAVQWQKTFGGSKSDGGRSVQQTSDGGYIIAGTTESFGADWLDVYLIKTDSTGNFLWQKTFGGSDFDWGYSVQQTTDGGYIIAGTTCSFGAGLEDVYLIKADPNGNLLWQKTFGGSSDDYGSSIQQTSDGGYIIAGVTESFGAGKSDVYLIKTDPNGNLLWQKTFGGSSEDCGSSVQQTSDGGYIIAGATGSFGDPIGDVYLIKTDPNGNQEWQKTFGGSKWDYAYSVQQTSDGGFIIAGDTESFGARNEPNVYLIKTDPNGNQEWQKSFGGRNGDAGYSVQQTSGGGFIITGESGGDVCLIKTDPNGNQEWQKTFGKVYTADDGFSVQQTIDGGFIIAGSTDTYVQWPRAGQYRSDVYIIKTDSIGNLQWQKTFGGNYNDSGRSIQQTSDGGYIVAGVTCSFGAGGGDVYLIKLSAEFCQYELFGDVNNDCKFDFYDFAIMAANWLIDCNINPSDPACLPE
jgi:regulation of enolase protein 1 (concanavalin A-like superfamily)